MTYYKATRPDGTDFRTGTFDYAGALVSGDTIWHPSPEGGMSLGDAGTYLSVSVEPAETLIGGSWPCRLFEVEPVGGAYETEDYHHKRAVSALRVVRELPAWQALGPNGEEVAAFITRASAVRAAAWDAARTAVWEAAWDAARTAVWEAAREAAWAAARTAVWAAALDTAWDAVRAAAWDAARTAVWDAAWDAVRAAAWDASQAAALGYVAQDLIPPEQFDALTRPWRIMAGGIG